MPEPIKIEEVKERVILVGVSEQDGDDAEDSVAEIGAPQVVARRTRRVHPQSYGHRPAQARTASRLAFSH